ncbi:penicillin-binding protein 1A [soil metagenome]
MKRLNYLVRSGMWTLLSLGLTIAFIIGCFLFFLEVQLPDVSVLKDYQWQVPLRVYTKDGKLMAEFGEIRRTPLELNQVPKLLINAVLATEDQRYYEHSGVDLLGLARASSELLMTGSKSQGGSTITMQVARNFFLTRKKTYSRKLKEILLAMKIDRNLSKEKILELYLNAIYLGNRAYGMVAGAHVYYGKNLNELTLPEMAMLAGLPKAPSTINPIADRTAARARRDHVLLRMYERNYIDKQTYERAIVVPETASYHGQVIAIKAPYVAEMVRDALVAQFGEKVAYSQGYQVYTTVDSKLQEAANQSLRTALLAYDQRHGYRGAEAPKAVSDDDDDDEDSYTGPPALKNSRVINGLIPAVVTRANGDEITATLQNGKTITIPEEGFSWVGRGLRLKRGSIIRVESSKEGWRLAQIPQAEAALVSLQPDSGAILSLVGGFDFTRSHYNRALQAQRQPGSNFKPFVYAAALDKGFTLASIINDAPIVLSDPVQGVWRPQNADHRFLGPTRLRMGLVKSRNLVSIRLLDSIGMSYALNYLTRFGFDRKDLPRNLSLALGTASLTPLQLVGGYAVFANGGYQVKPYVIDHILNSNGQLIYQTLPPVHCDTCYAPIGNATPAVKPKGPVAPRVLSPQTAYLMYSVLQDVIRKGTGRDALALNRNDVGGKTGTTQFEMNAWFTGFNRDAVTTAWVGFDQPQSLHEYGAQAALPMWLDYMREALKGKPEHALEEPPGIVSARIDPRTGLLAGEGQDNAIFEIFREGEVPKDEAPVGAAPREEAEVGEPGAAAPSSSTNSNEPLF